MFLTNKTYEAMIELLTLTFQGNSHADNCAYWLGFNQLLEAEENFHEKYAHAFPKWADEISDFLGEMGARAIRGPLEGNNKNYQNIGELFTDVKAFFVNYKTKIKEVIEVAEINEDLDVKTFLEDYSLRLCKYLKQVDIWEKKSLLLIDDVISFDDNFDDYTII